MITYKVCKTTLLKIPYYSVVKDRIDSRARCLEANIYLHLTRAQSLFGSRAKYLSRLIWFGGADRD